MNRSSRALVTLEGLGRQYDPDFRIVEHLQTPLRLALLERYGPSSLVQRGRTNLAGIVNLLGSVPRDIVRLLRDARRSKTRIDLDLKRLDDFGLQLDRTIDSATLGIMTASLVIGSAVVMTVPGGPALFGVPH